MQSYEKTLHKLARFSNHLIFNIRCSKAKLTPLSLRIQPPIRTGKGYRIAEQASKKFLQERIRLAHFKKSTLKKEAEELRVQLAKKLDWNDYDNIIERCEISANKTFVSTKRPTNSEV